MAWTIPMTFVSNVPLTAAHLNTFVRDNFNETAPGRATVAGRWFVSAGRNTVAERPITAARLGSAISYSSVWGTGGVAGPTVSFVTGDQVLVGLTADMDVDFASLIAESLKTGYMGYEVSGASSILPSDDRSLHWTQLQATATLSSQARYRQSYVFWQPVSSGLNTFTVKYRFAGESDGHAQFLNIQILVMAL